MSTPPNIDRISIEAYRASVETSIEHLSNSLSNIDRTDRSNTYRFACLGPMHRSVSKCSLRTARFTRFDINSKIANRNPVECVSLGSIVFAGFLCRMGPHNKDPLISATTRYDPLRPAKTRYGPLRFGSHGSVLTVRLSQSEHS